MASTAAATSRGSERKNAIGNFIVSKVKGDVMRKYIADNGIRSDQVDSEIEGDEALGAALSIYFRDTIPEKDMCACERCAGEGPDVPTCPFCGLEGSADPATAETDTAQLAAEVEAKEPASGKKKSSKKEKAKDDMPKSTALAKKGETAVAVAGEVVFSEKDLDASVHRIEALKQSASLSLWALGDELRRVHESSLWKQRLNEKGKAKYSSFNQFAETEAKISDTYAYKLIDIAKNFEEVDVKKFGTSKLTLLLQVSPEDRPALKEKALTSSKRELKEEVEKVVKEKGGAKKTRQAEAGAKGAKAKQKTAAAKSDKITVANVVDRKLTVKLFAKPDSLRNIDWDNLKRAKTLDAQPMGKLELSNEVSMLITFDKKEDGLVAVVTFRRDA